MDEAVWQTTLGEIELTTSRASFVTWFKNTRFLDSDGDTIKIGVPNIFAKQQLEVKFNDQINETLKKNGAKFSEVIYVIDNKTTKTQSDVDNVFQASVATHTAKAKNKTDNSGLNPKYDFKTFIVGSGNELAHAACQAIVKSPGTKYNPMFIYGGVGLGKTHLLQAVGNALLEEKPDTRILYISSETFVNDFLDSIRFKKKGFADKYRSVDVLIIDDMQFIGGKEKTQEEFFHTFNALHQTNKQIIISSDKPPKAIPTLSERLRSRFEWGMTIDIQAPDFETRCAILQVKASSQGIELDQETVEFLATHFQTNIRELEGALNQLLAFSEMRGVEPNLETATSILNGSRIRPKHVSAKNVVEKTAKYFSVELPDIVGPKRDREVVVPRQIAMYLLRSELHMSFPKVARELGRKDHTTAIHSVDKIEQAIATNSTVRQQVNEIKEKLYA
ncbi:Chromosomal replication initiator protein DnaA [hydrothermal vent metagenome]|uniref:Chromosomal replication initiator protein DnaA n=1 Tax=hydrothermal vent metagenome TaxID=652676 RepID=A0A3B0UMW6_9ZZZZ